ncbi:hypothetical protein [Paenibacillus flagellatus]|uniref:GGDEF domain-containing protein n=1 Tax=Paenibacillus flagellatus TaxID=2211139 RepID=A0A2V5JYZ6_9BACL|nr:hypothetical protein [Paenibacillus flagellatus]PYI52028.1 hypothetical protein DLM86_21310 [Paenibacillus flagellatus]
MADTNTAPYAKGIAIGIIGPEPLVEKMNQCLRGFPSFDPIARSYSREEEAPELARDIMDHVEVMLFSGPVPYRLAVQKLNFKIPVHYVRLSGTGLYRALFRIGRRHGLEEMSVDTVSKQSVEGAFEELGERSKAVAYYPGSEFVSKDALVEFHAEQYRLGKAKAALTGVGSVSAALTEMGIPNEWVLPTDQDIIVALERSLLSTESRRSKESQIVVGFIHVDEFDRLAKKKTSEHEVQRLKLDIHRMLLGYVESLDGHLTHMGGNEYLFITTRGIFERETGGYKSIPLARVVEKYYGLSLSIGIGFGRSANEAGTHARLALRNSKESGGDICFIVREDKSVIGPLEMTHPHEYDLSLIDASLLKRAEEAGLTSGYLSKLVAHVTRFGKTDYTAQELATVLDVTVRSTHRFLLAWLDSGLIDIIGEEKGKSKGRPKQIYRLSFLSELVR